VQVVVEDGTDGRLVVGGDRGAAGGPGGGRETGERRRRGEQETTGHDELRWTVDGSSRLDRDRAGVSAMS